MHTTCFISLRSSFKLNSVPFLRIMWKTAWCQILQNCNLDTAVRIACHNLLSVFTSILYCMHTYVSVTCNVSVQYITWSLISSLLYMYFIHLPITPSYIRWVSCRMDIIYLFQVTERKSVCIVSGITRFIGAWGEKWQWPPVTEIMVLKKSQSVTEFPLYLAQ